MKSTIKKGVIVLIIAILNFQTQAQTPVGNWKRISMIVENAKGEKTDTHKELVQQMPCTETIIYSFLANGKMAQKVKGCAAGIKKSIENAAQKSSWTMKGNVMYTTYSGDKTLNSKCTVTYSGNKMIMKYTYKPGDFNPEQLKSLIVIYQKV